MIDLNTPLADHVFRLLFLSAGLLMITERTIHMAMIKMDGDIHWYRPDRMMKFVTNDLTIFGLTLAATLGSLLPPVLASSPSYVYHFLTAIRSDLGWFGWLMTVAVAVQLLAPFIVGICLLVGRQRRKVHFGVGLKNVSNWA